MSQTSDDFFDCCQFSVKNRSFSKLCFFANSFFFQGIYELLSGRFGGWGYHFMQVRIRPLYNKLY